MTNFLTRHQLAKLLMPALIIIPLLAGGCASVPEESVELSYIIGNDLEIIRQSYTDLIQQHFKSLRTQINTSIDKVYIPSFISSFAAKGKLAQHAKNNRTDLVEAWARVAINRIERERIKRLAPIDMQEKELMVSVDEAFDRVIRANATLTAHLNSIQKVNAAQDELLASFKLKDIRGKINTGLANASVKADKIAADIDKLKGKLKLSESNQ